MYSKAKFTLYSHHMALCLSNLLFKSKNDVVSKSEGVLEGVQAR